MKKISKIIFLFVALYAINIFGQTVSTFAGSTEGFMDGQVNVAKFDFPCSSVIDKDGNMYVCDASNRIIRKITPDGLVSTFAGIPNQAGSVNGPLSQAKFNFPRGIMIDPFGNFFITDTFQIRKISTDGIVSTYAGSGAKGSIDGPANMATFNGVNGIVMDSKGNIFVADEGNFKIRKISKDGMVSTFAGSGVDVSLDGIGIQAAFLEPVDLAIDASDIIYGTDVSRIFKLTPDGIVTTFAGSKEFVGDNLGNGDSALFEELEGIEFDSFGNLYVSDFLNRKIKKIDPNREVTLVAGSTRGYEDGDIANAKFNSLGYIVFDKRGNLYVTELVDHRIRKITFSNLYTNLNNLEDSIKICPNPTSSFLDINLTSNSNADFTLVDLSGKVLKKERITLQAKINLSDFAAGIYMAKIETDKGILTKKIIKQ